MSELEPGEVRDAPRKPSAILSWFFWKSVIVRERKERPYDPKNYCKSYLYERTQDEKKIPTKQGNKINVRGE